MYGVIVVPTTATINSRIGALNVTDGVTNERATAPQSGWASTADAMYVMNTSDNGQEDPLDDPVGREQHERPDRDRHDRHDDDPGDAEDLQGGRRAGELGDRVRDVRDEQDHHREDRPADAEPVADEVRQALAGHHAQPGRPSPGRRPG